MGKKKISIADLDALRRAIKWGERYARSEPQLKIMPDPMPREGSQEWLKLATSLAATAQYDTLGLKPWQTEPLHVVDNGVIDPNGWGNRPDEVALRWKMLALGISLFEPDPPGAIARAEQIMRCP
jgi:hypothetical protein